MKRLLVTVKRLALLVLLPLVLTACGQESAPTLAVHDILNPSNSINLGQPQKPTLVVFWATSCSSCIDEIPSIIQLQQAYGDKIAIAAIAMSFDDPQVLSKFAEQRKLPYLVAHDADEQVAQGFGKIFVTPTNLLLDQQGKIVWKNVGDFDMALLKKRIDSLL